MASLVTSEIRRHTQRAGSFRGVSLAILVFSFHWALVAYINSTFMHQFVSDEVVGALYTIGSIGTIVVFLFSSRILRFFGNYRATLWLAIGEILILVGLGLASSPYVAIPLFILHHAIVPLLLFTIDIFTEHDIGKNEGVTGSSRGMLLTVISLGCALAILAAGLLLGGVTPRFTWVYLASAACMLLFWQYVRHTLHTFRDVRYTDINVFGILRHFWITHDFRFVFLSHFLLQLFFAWMVIYTPLYLSTTIGFAWQEIGLLLFVALMAFVVFEYPIGKIADRYIGEKEMMAAGFIILAVTTAYMGFLKTPLLVPWMITLFMSRFGASLVEVTTESYFFKHTKDADANIISFFRASRPLAYILGALIGSLTLLYTSFSYTFLLFGLLMLPGVVFALFLKDTR